MFKNFQAFRGPLDSRRIIGEGSGGTWPISVVNQQHGEDSTAGFCGRLKSIIPKAHKPRSPRNTTRQFYSGGSRELCNITDDWQGLTDVKILKAE